MTCPDTSDLISRNGEVVEPTLSAEGFYLCLFFWVLAKTRGVEFYIFNLEGIYKGFLIKDGDPRITPRKDVDCH